MTNLDEMNALAFADRSDFEDADRGFLGAITPCVVSDPWTTSAGSRGC